MHRTGANTPRATKRGFIINWGINGLSLEFLTSTLGSAVTVVMEGCAARTVLAGSAVFSAVMGFRSKVYNNPIVKH